MTYELTQWINDKKCRKKKYFPFYLTGEFQHSIEVKHNDEHVISLELSNLEVGYEEGRFLAQIRKVFKVYQGPQEEEEEYKDKRPRKKDKKTASSDSDSESEQSDSTKRRSAQKRRKRVPASKSKKVYQGQQEEKEYKDKRSNKKTANSDSDSESEQSDSTKCRSTQKHRKRAHASKSKKSKQTSHHESSANSTDDESANCAKSHPSVRVSKSKRSKQSSDDQSDANESVDNESTNYSQLTGSDKIIIKEELPKIEEIISTQKLSDATEAVPTGLFVADSNDPSQQPLDSDFHHLSSNLNTSQTDTNTPQSPTQIFSKNNVGVPTPKPKGVSFYYFNYNPHNFR